MGWGTHRAGWLCRHRGCCHRSTHPPQGILPLCSQMCGHIVSSFIAFHSKIYFSILIMCTREHKSCRVAATLDPLELELEVPQELNSGPP